MSPTSHSVSLKITTNLLINGQPYDTTRDGKPIADGANMSADEDEGSRDYLTISAYTDFEDDDEALESLVNLKELEFGDVFTERTTTLDSDETEGLSIVFTHSEHANFLRITTTGGGHVHITGRINDEHIADVDNVMDKLLDKVGEISIEVLSVVVFLDIEFDSLAFPVKSETSYDISGIRITEENAHYIIQETDHRGTTFVSRDRRVDDDNTYDELKPVGNSDVEAIEQFIAEFE